LAVVFEKLVEQCVGDEWFHWDVLVLLMGHISGKHLHKNYDTPDCRRARDILHILSIIPILLSTQKPYPPAQKSGGKSCSNLTASFAP